MNYLQLCQRLVQETGIADSGPATVTGQSGDMLRVVNWINDSWVKIQSMRPDWSWMWAQGSAVLAEGSDSITLPATVERLSLVHINNGVLNPITFADYSRAYLTTSAGKPNLYSIRPNGDVAFNATADADYTVYYDYYKAPAYFTGGTDAPTLPTRYHMLIVYNALRQYAQFDVAPELEAKAVLNFEDMLADLSRDQQPHVLLPETLA